MIAALPMYDRPETRAANDRLWQLIRGELIDQGRDAPTQLTRDLDPWEVWLRPDLVLAQTCGLPYRTELHGKVNLVGTPVCDIDCADGYYFSVIVARDGVKPPPKPVVAINDGRSQSGWAALVAWLDGREVDRIVQAGAHVASAKAVADRAADLAAIDAVTWQMIQRWEPWADRLQVIGRTAPTPTLPYITASQHNPKVILKAVERAIAALPPKDQQTLCLRGLTRISAEDYLAVSTPPPPAI